MKNNKGLVVLNMMMVAFMKDIGKILTENLAKMVLEHTLNPIEKSIKVIGKMIKCMDKEYIITRQELNILENLKTAYHMEK